MAVGSREAAVAGHGSHPLLRAWMRWRLRQLAAVPRPADSTIVGSRGSQPLECVALGNGALTGWGVASHQLGLIGALSRSLTRQFGRGVTVRGAIDPYLTVRTMRPLVPQQPWGSAAVGILAFGPGEVIAAGSLRTWQHDLDLLVREVRSRMPPGSMLAVLSIPPLAAIGPLHGIGSRSAAWRIAKHNERAAAVCAGIDGVRFIPLPDPGASRRGYEHSADQYAFWADVIAAFVAFEPPTARVTLPPADERSRSVDELGILDGRVDPEPFERIVRLAQNVFRTASAAFTVLHDDWQWYAARAGTPLDRLPREQSLCDLAVAQSAPLVVGDTWSDARFDANEYVHEGDGVRFYAGHPLRAPDGNLIGALCVFDPEPRDPRDVDLATLRDLALMIESELAHPQSRGPLPDPRS